MSSVSGIESALEVTTNPVFAGKENCHQQIGYNPVVE
jgi:hypothetical protein